jgi:hypothetical protein
MTVDLPRSASTRWPPSPSSQSFLHNHMYGSLRGLPEYERLSSLLAEAEKEGQIVIRGESDPTTKRMGISVVLLPEASKVPRIKIIEEEIFGPIIPIIPVEVGRVGAVGAASRQMLRLGDCAEKDRTWTRRSVM